MDHAVYTTVLKLALCFVGVWLAPVVAYAPAPAFVFVIVYTVQLYVTMAYLPYNNTEFGLDILHEDLVDPNEKVRVCVCVLVCVHALHCPRVMWPCSCGCCV